MLSAGTCVEWLRDDLGLLATAQESATWPRRCDDIRRRLVRAGASRAGHAGLGLRGAGHHRGLTRGSGRPKSCGPSRGRGPRGPTWWRRPRADSGHAIESLRIDGGMSDNDVFVEALADAIGRPVEISPVLEATTLGAGFLAGLAIGIYGSTEELARRSRPAARSNLEATTLTRSSAWSAGWRHGPRPRPPFRSSRASPSERVVPLRRRRVSRGTPAWVRSSDVAPVVAPTPPGGRGHGRTYQEPGDSERQLPGQRCAGERSDSVSAELRGQAGWRCQRWRSTPSDRGRDRPERRGRPRASPRCW